MLACSPGVSSPRLQRTPTKPCREKTNESSTAARLHFSIDLRSPRGHRLVGLPLPPRSLYKKPAFCFLLSTREHISRHIVSLSRRTARSRSLIVYWSFLCSKHLSFPIFHRTGLIYSIDWSSDQLHIHFVAHSTIESLYSKILTQHYTS